MLDSVAKVGCDSMLDSKLTHQCSIDFMPHGMASGMQLKKASNFAGSCRVSFLTRHLEIARSLRRSVATAPGIQKDTFCLASCLMIRALAKPSLREVDTRQSSEGSHDNLLVQSNERVVDVRCW